MVSRVMFLFVGATCEALATGGMTEAEGNDRTLLTTIIRSSGS